MEGAGHASLRAVIRDRAGSAVIGRRLMLQAVRGLARLTARIALRIKLPLVRLAIVMLVFLNLIGYDREDLV